MQFKLKCLQCGETIICDETILDQQMTCGDCGYPIVIESYPKLLELKEKREQARREERQRQATERERLKAQKAEEKRLAKAERAERKKAELALSLEQRKIALAEKHAVLIERQQQQQRQQWQQQQQQPQQPAQQTVVVQRNSNCAVWLILILLLIVFCPLLVCYIVTGSACLLIPAAMETSTPPPKPEAETLEDETTSTPIPPPEPEAKTGPVLKILSIDSRITESNEVWVKYAWILKVKNNSNRTMSFDAKINFMDKDGFIIDDDDEYGLAISPQTEDTFEGYTLVSMPGARNVETIQANISTD